VSRFQEWAKREYSPEQRIIFLAFLGILFVIVVPFFLVVVSPYLDQALQLPRFGNGLMNAFVGLPLIVIGAAFALWSIQTQFTLGKGTPAPMMPTRRLVALGPYSHCRNPMTFGTLLFYLGMGVWIGSAFAVCLTLLLAVLLIMYIKVIEERELELRFGEEYLQYKRGTSFIVPRLRRYTRQEAEACPES
jgi:protein-S-isoprenylcysteine O-methyltransferase Ste14